MDISDVTRVVVYGVPASISQYYQVETRVFKFTGVEADCADGIYVYLHFLANWSCRSCWTTI